MKAAGVVRLQPLVVLFCALILCESSFTQSPSSFPSDATHVAIFRLGSLTGKVESVDYRGTIAVGEASFVASASGFELRIESGLLAMLMFLGSADGDVNRDGRIDYLDLFVLQQWWQQIHQNDPWLAAGDLDHNGVIDYRDFFDFMRLWRQIGQIQEYRSTGQSFPQKQSSAIPRESSGGSER